MKYQHAEPAFDLFHQRQDFRRIHNLNADINSVQPRNIIARHHSGAIITWRNIGTINTVCKNLNNPKLRNISHRRREHLQHQRSAKNSPLERRQLESFDLLSGKFLISKYFNLHYLTAADIRISCEFGQDSRIALQSRSVTL